MFESAFSERYFYAQRLTHETSDKFQVDP